MTPRISDRKRRLRQETLARLGQMTPAQIAAASAQLRARLERQTLWQAARSVLFFAPMPAELDIWPLFLDALAAGKIAALPRFVRATKSYVACQVHNAAADVQAGYYGIREPADHCIPMPLNRLDLVLVPGVAFDLHGRRLGRGKGYYDQLLADVRGKTCGVAFDEQIVPEVPVEPHDVHLNCILTPTRWLEL